MCPPKDGSFSQIYRIVQVNLVIGGGDYLEKGIRGSRWWTIVADERMFYVVINWGSHNALFQQGVTDNTYCFGDLNSINSINDYDCIICSSPSYITNNTTSSTGYYYAQSKTSNFCLLNNNDIRRIARVDGSQPLVFRGNSRSGYFGYSGYTYPNPHDQSLLYYQDIEIDSNNTLRGFLPGVYQLLHHVPFSEFQILSNLENHGNKKFLIKNISAGVDGSLTATPPRRTTPSDNSCLILQDPGDESHFFPRNKWA